MSKARLIITAITVEGRSPSEVARDYGVARSWVYTLLARYHNEGEATLNHAHDDHTHDLTPHRRTQSTSSSNSAVNSPPTVSMPALTPSAGTSNTTTN